VLKSTGKYRKNPAMPDSEWGAIAMSVLEMSGDVVDESIESPPGINGFHIEPRCRVCRDDEVRKKVNGLLATGSSYAMVLRALGADKDTLGKGDRVTIDSIRNHAARHFPVQQIARATYREIIERRAQEAQIDFVNGVATALTPLAFYEVVMNEAFRRLVDGEVDVSVDTGLRAAEKLQTLIDARAPGADWAGALAQMGRIIDVVKPSSHETGGPRSKPHCALIRPYMRSSPSLQRVSGWSTLTTWLTRMAAPRFEPI
jgi:hypothetical protein